MHRKYTFIMRQTMLCLSALALGIACNKNSNFKPKDAPEAPPRDALFGNWQSNCVEGKSLALAGRTSLGITQRSQLAIDDHSVTETAIVSSQTCDSDDLEITVSSAFDRAAAQGLAQPRPINIKVNRVAIKPVTEFGVRVLNLASWCGIKDWAIGQERDVTASVGQDKCQAVRAIRTIYSIDGSSLYFGSTEASLASSAGPAMELKKDFYFTRQ